MLYKEMNRVLLKLLDRFKIHTTACIINFKPNNHFVIFIGGLLCMVSLMPQLHLLSTP